MPKDKYILFLETNINNYKPIFIKFKYLNFRDYLNIWSDVFSFNHIH